MMKEQSKVNKQVVTLTRSNSLSRSNSLTRSNSLRNTKYIVIRNLLLPSKEKKSRNNTPSLLSKIWSLIPTPRISSGTFHYQRY